MQALQGNKISSRYGFIYIGREFNFHHEGISTASGCGKTVYNGTVFSYPGFIFTTVYRRRVHTRVWWNWWYTVIFKAIWLFLKTSLTDDLILLLPKKAAHKYVAVSKNKKVPHLCRTFLFMAISKNCFAGDLWNFARKISTFFWLSIAGYAIEKEIERFR